MGDLTAEEIQKLQAIADRHHAPINIVGSAARGTRRGIGSGLPLGLARSDLDLAIPRNMKGGPMEYDLLREFANDIDPAHGVLVFVPPSQRDEILISPK